MDRYFKLSQNPIDSNKIQLIGVSCLFISSKLEEIFPVHLVKLVKEACHSHITQEEIKNMELQIIETLHFDFTYVTSFEFLYYFSKIFKIRPEIINDTITILYISLFHYEYLGYNQKQITTAALVLVIKQYSDFFLVNEILTSSDLF